MEKPTVGRIVHVVVPERVNSADVFPAIVVQTFSDGEGRVSDRVNLNVLLPGGGMRGYYSVAHLSERDKIVAANRHVDPTYEPAEPFWFWPPRA